MAILRDTRGSILSEGTKWHSKLTRYYKNVIKSQGNSSSVLPFVGLINQKLVENDGQVMFLTYENTTSLGLMIQTDSTQDWQVDWDGSGDWQTWNSSSSTRKKDFSTTTSGVAFIRSATGNSIEDINFIRSIVGNWNFDISVLSNVSDTVFFYGSSISPMILTGDISSLSNVSYVVRFQGSNMTLTYTTTTWGTVPSDNFQLRLSPGHLTQSEVDQLFIDLNNAGTTGTATINFGGKSNAAPSSASASARTALASRGYNLIHN